MPTDIYTMDSLKITVKDEYADVVPHVERALKGKDRTIEFLKPSPTTIVVDKITAIVAVQTGMSGG